MEKETFEARSERLGNQWSCISVVSVFVGPPVPWRERWLWLPGSAGGSRSDASAITAVEGGEGRGGAGHEQHPG